jgi:hypothetical protein
MKNLDGRSLFGWTLTKGNIMKEESYKDYFEELEYYDDNLLLKFKQEFENDFWDEGKSIKYHLFLNITGEEEYGYHVLLYMMPTKEYISNTILEEIATLYDMPIEDITEREIVNDRIVPMLQQQELDFTVEGTWYTDNVIELLETATSVLPMIDRMIGFSLDKAINMIGTTNWDCLEGLLKGFDPISRTIDNFKEVK